MFCFFCTAKLLGGVVCADEGMWYWFEGALSAVARTGGLLKFNKVNREEVVGREWYSG